MDLTHYRSSAQEQQRTADLLRLMPKSGRRALDIGARDGHFSLLMAERFDEVIALDLTKPRIEHPRIKCVQGNAASLPYEDNAFDFVFCAEVLEHVPGNLLHDVCREIERVASRCILIGVPYMQDIRVGRTTCSACGKVNPPWGHVNSFDERRIKDCFVNCEVKSIAFVGISSEKTNAVSAALMDYAGNPYGSYGQEEACISCGSRLTQSSTRSFAQRVATRLAVWLRRASELFEEPHGNWMHVVFQKLM